MKNHKLCIIQKKGSGKKSKKGIRKDEENKLSGTSTSEIKKEFLKSKLGLTGIFILSGLIVVSIITISVIPTSTFQEWNNPEKWISYPKTSVPSWVNYLSSEKIPEHKIINAEVFKSYNDGIFLTSQQFGIYFDYDDFSK